PEEVGGVRNWDYRFTWLRDASLTLEALYALGFHEEAHRFMHWCAQRCREGELQIMYRVDGKPDLEERVLNLAGWRGSRPVRVGNAASKQRQLDVYGEVLDSAFLFSERVGEVDDELWFVVRDMAGLAAKGWRTPDHGIWEMRGEPHQFVHSKVNCWVALDRAIAIATRHGRDCPELALWRTERDAIRAEVYAHGIDSRTGAFVQQFGSRALDAAALRFPSLGFVHPKDPHMLATVAQIEARLLRQGYVRRYLQEESPDALSGGEGAFTPCSFWLVEVLAKQGEGEKARVLFDRLVARATPLGLFSEEIEPATGVQIGNFPQAFTHVGLIRAAIALDAGEQAEGSRS
ncbi:MAG: glycoside hydrolase family 15 protein, partial [Deltaproteobacteria bacterium]